MRHLLSGSVLALLIGSGAAAQNSQTASAPKVKADNGSAVTLTGCLTIGGATNLMLTNITAEQEQEHRRTAPSASYALIEPDDLPLAGYINQRVQLTGVVVPAATSRDKDDKFTVKDGSTTSRSGSGKTDSRTVKVARGADSQLIVAAVKSVAPTCQ